MRSSMSEQKYNLVLGFRPADKGEKLTAFAMGLVGATAELMDKLGLDDGRTVEVKVAVQGQTLRFSLEPTGAAGDH